MQETALGELILARIHAGPAFALARIQEIHLRIFFAACLFKSLEEFIVVQIQAKYSGELFMYWFRARAKCTVSRR